MSKESQEELERRQQEERRAQWPDMTIMDRIYNEASRKVHDNTRKTKGVDSSAVVQSPAAVTLPVEPVVLPVLVQSPVRPHQPPPVVSIPEQLPPQV